jgi:hypothetical protein
MAYSRVMQLRRLVGRTAGLGSLAVALTLAVAPAGQADPGYRYELNPDDDYTPGSDLVISGTSSGRGTTAPFELRLYDEVRAQIFVHTRGFVLLGGTFSTAKTCLPAANFSPGVFPFWAEAANQSASGTGYGVYQGVTGTEPNRRYILDWRVFKPGTAPLIERQFEVIFYESSPIVTTVYSGPVGGADATIGISRGGAGPHTQYSCGSTSIPGGSYRVDYIPDPMNVSPPTIAGDARVGQQLQGTTGEWDGTEPIEYAFQWSRCDSDLSSCTDVAGATSATYVPGPADVGQRLRLRVTAMTTQFPYAYDDSAESTPTGVVPPVPAGPPSPALGGAAPRIDSLSVSPRTLTPVNRRTGSVAYVLSEAAEVRFAVLKAAPGRRKGKRCLRPKTGDANVPRCRRFVKLPGAFEDRGEAGANALPFRARIGGLPLAPGSYRLRAIATDAERLSSQPKVATFAVSGRPKR